MLDIHWRSIYDDSWIQLDNWDVYRFYLVCLLVWGKPNKNMRKKLYDRGFKQPDMGGGMRQPDAIFSHPQSGRGLRNGLLSYTPKTGMSFILTANWLVLGILLNFWHCIYHKDITHLQLYQGCSHRPGDFWGENSEDQEINDRFSALKKIHP